MKKALLLSAIAIAGIVAWGFVANANVGKSDKQQIIDLEHGLIDPPTPRTLTR